MEEPQRIKNVASSKPKTPSKRKPPTPQELISHYESQGLDSNAAAVKVIDDLQKALFGVISSGRGKKDRLLADSSRKIDSLNSRITILDLKLDSKPGYPETFAIGIASGAALKGIGAVMPQILGGLAQIWNSVTSATRSSS
ncbi:uncharacterized protein LOC129296921 [Prosopis cineraria]|uniref:uncharacterized protein LOC129296921 n=1 Tax=Prosopis cineraria TaxID=364024 RepID=UPI00240F4DFC|nr:uncharacterized protein LOC129296921 [Prosopis cineraria]XP_054791288.1 uncharacterized protein LOC129296921 [Prosopis cineraria]XP_054791289.1 uncharacterized protein LOC129296921 [Prosopis cineraria]XP_054791290.1 uncharacterized protein LOC129296921 [Prosopis cineraria]XP_054791291.1 uncharacterized protein LOC129296921 [Prosopis cineraria]XP_054791292.1 uncharacterized protein LOC129296921 [Prosopis cineraria]